MRVFILLFLAAVASAKPKSSLAKLAPLLKHRDHLPERYIVKLKASKPNKDLTSPNKKYDAGRNGIN